MNSVRLSPGGWSCCDEDPIAGGGVDPGEECGGYYATTPMLNEVYKKVRTLRRGAQGVVYLAQPRGRDSGEKYVAVKRIFPVSLGAGMCAGVTDLTQREISILHHLTEESKGDPTSPFVRLEDVVLSARGTRSKRSVDEPQEPQLDDSPCIGGMPPTNGASSPALEGDEVCLVMEYCPMDLSSQDGIVGRCRKPILLPHGTDPIGIEASGEDGGGLAAAHGRRALSFAPPKIALSLGLGDDEDSDDGDVVVDFAAKFAQRGSDSDTVDEISGGREAGPVPSAAGSINLQDELAVRQAIVRMLLQQILRGAATLHSCGILHRDIKGSNILLTAASVTSSRRLPFIRYADFGSARSLQTPTGALSPSQPRSEMDDEDANDTRLTSAVNRTTLLYRSPETLLNAHSGGAAYCTPADMWAVGVVFAELLLSVVRPVRDHNFGKASSSRWGLGGAQHRSNDHYLFQVQTEMELIGAIYKLIGPPSTNTSFLHCGEEGTPRAQEREQKPLIPVTPPSLLDNTATLRVKFAALTTDTGLHLLARLLTMDPVDRITAEEALQHPYFTDHHDQPLSEEKGDRTARELAEELLVRWCDEDRSAALQH